MRATRALAVLAVAIVSIAAGGSAVRAALLAGDVSAAAVLVGIAGLVALTVAATAVGRPGSTPYW